MNMPRKLQWISAKAAVVEKIYGESSAMSGGNITRDLFIRSAPARIPEKHLIF